MGVEHAVSTRPGVFGMGARMLLKVVLATFCILVVLISTIFFFNYAWLLWIMEILYLATVIAFLASPMNSRGHRDIGYFSRHPEQKDSLYGLKAGLIAAAPFYLTTVLAILMTLGYLPDLFIFYRVINAFFWPLISLIVEPGAPVYDLSWYHFLVFFLMQSVIPLTCHIAYTLGLKNIALLDRIVYRGKREKN